MARPQTAEDLSAYERAPHEFVKVDLQFLISDVTVGAAVLALVDAARRSEYFHVDEDGQFLVTVPLTDAEVVRKIESAQRMWDHNRDDYVAALEGTKPLEVWRRATIDQWAKNEDWDAIDWAAHDTKFGVAS